MGSMKTTTEPYHQERVFEKDVAKTCNAMDERGYDMVALIPGWGSQPWTTILFKTRKDTVPGLSRMTYG